MDPVSHDPVLSFLKFSEFPSVREESGTTETIQGLAMCFALT